MATTVFINEFHYDNAGTDSGEFVEIAAPAGTDLTGWRIVLYNGAPSGTTGLKAYATTTLGGIVANQQNGFGTISVGYPANGIQNGGAGANGEPDGIALVNAAGTVVQFLSYEGSFTALDGPAAGMASVNVGNGVFEDGTRTGTSIGLVGTGTGLSDFTYAIIGTASAGAVNAGQSFAGAAPVTPGTLAIADASTVEGNGGVHDIVFTVTRADGSSGAVSATWTVTLPGGAGGADAADFAPGQALSGLVSFASGATSAEVRLSVQGDTVFEGNETFTVALSNPQGGVALGDASAVGTITNDDAAPPAPPANVFINEIHYDNVGTDAGEAIEIAGTAGTNLSGYTLVFYNGSNTPAAAPVYDTLALSGTIDDEGNGFGAIGFPRAGLQNGIADGVALIAPDGRVVQLLSYEGTFTAAAGTPAAGMTSTDIGVAEEPAVGIGQSLQLKGSGSSAADFTWSAASADSFGTLNAGQSFLSATGTGRLRIDDARVVEGDGGVSNLVFTVHRAGGSALSASVAYAVNLDGTATADDLAPGAALGGVLTFAAGEFTKQIVVPVQGDTLSEGNETLSVTLGATTGDVVIDDGRAIGTIVNDDLLALSIGAIQGAGHVSTYVGQTVLTNGVVTAVDTNGFYLQSATGDGDAATSDAIFVFTGTAPAVTVGDEARVRGSVSEFAGDAKGLSVTQIVTPTVDVVSRGNPLPAAVLIGTGGILPPTQVLDDDRLTVFDPLHDGLDFWESLEGMRVTLDTPQAVSNTTSFGETDVVVSHGVGATGINDRGGITIAPNADGTVDYNPEKIQIDDDSGIFAGFTPNYTIGDQLTSVTGIVNYSFDAYEVLVTGAVSVTKDVTLQKEVTTLAGDANFLSLATYNLENLDTSDNKFDILASNIVYNLRAPDILAVQEVQDADGAGTGGNLSGTVTAQGLIDAIYAQSGLRYGYVEIAPTTTNTSGGEPNGNIRNGYFYNLDRVSYVEGSAQLIEGGAYDGSRKPLVAQFQFAGQTITAIDVHFTSRGGSDPLLGNTQPAAAAGDAARTAQAAGVKAYVEAHLADDPSLHFAVLGDWNGFYFEDAQTQLTDPAKGGVFTNLNTLLPSEERYSYLFEGNAQQIDNVLVTGGLLTNAQYDSVHLNSQFGGDRPTDHDPQLALLMLGAAPIALSLIAGSVDENRAAGTEAGFMLAFDTPNDVLRYSLLDDAGGRFKVDPVTGIVTTTGTLDYEAGASYAIVARATDSGGLTTQERFTIAVNDVDEGPGAGAVSFDFGDASTALVGRMPDDRDGGRWYADAHLADGIVQVAAYDDALWGGRIHHDGGNGYADAMAGHDGHAADVRDAAMIAVHRLVDVGHGI
ncbi:lamin tail domain-containing protein [Sphingomonas sp. A2-49]|uniref:Calx-beta domain-containing protein n=1 Tax=Sphingomonas sp. A2-49 TaxID=1391375 RepID=UPI0021D0FB50|nr:cadherin domain-containing protein [Sphingomonas sp. A2-49]MCU6454123.1 lamin tail domain-containing protein [Sphingomonas sp. A2-49]